MDSRSTEQVKGGTLGRKPSSVECAHD